MAVVQSAPSISDLRANTKNRPVPVCMTSACAVTLLYTHATMYAVYLQHADD
jgi:hypothetical protein